MQHRKINIFQSSWQSLTQCCEYSGYSALMFSSSSCNMRGLFWYTFSFNYSHSYLMQLLIYLEMLQATKCTERERIWPLNFEKTYSPVLQAFERHYLQNLSWKILPLNWKVLSIICEKPHCFWILNEKKEKAFTVFTQYIFMWFCGSAHLICTFHLGKLVILLWVLWLWNLPAYLLCTLLSLFYCGKFLWVSPLILLHTFTLLCMHCLLSTFSLAFFIHFFFPCSNA